MQYAHHLGLQLLGRQAGHDRTGTVSEPPHHADLDDDQTRDVIAAMSRREVQPDEIIIR